MVESSEISSCEHTVQEDDRCEHICQFLSSCKHQARIEPLAEKVWSNSPLVLDLGVSEFCLYSQTHFLSLGFV